jgi:hypothetical protein
MVFVGFVKTAREGLEINGEFSDAEFDWGVRG